MLPDRPRRRAPPWKALHRWTRLHGRASMETYEPIFTQVDVAGVVIDCPQTEHEWLYPDEYVGKNIIWFMVHHICLNDFVSTETINRFFRVEGSLKLLSQILSMANGQELVNTVENCRDYITDTDLQEQLINIIQSVKNLKPYAGYLMFVRRTKNEELRKFRHTIWSLLK